MNLHAAVSGAISAVNPMVEIIVEVSTGYRTDDAGMQVPNYAPAQSKLGQVQPLSGGELHHMDMLNLAGDFVGIYINGQVEGLIRSENKGGDRITIPSLGRTYLTTQVLESWPDWCKVVATLQNNR